MGENGGFASQDDQARYLQDANTNVKRAGYHMQQAMVSFIAKWTYQNIACDGRSLQPCLLNPGLNLYKWLPTNSRSRVAFWKSSHNQSIAACRMGTVWGRLWDILQRCSPSWGHHTWPLRSISSYICKCSTSWLSSRQVSFSCTACQIQYAASVCLRSALQWLPGLCSGFVGIFQGGTCQGKVVHRLVWASAARRQCCTKIVNPPVSHLPPFSNSWFAFSLDTMSSACK